MAALAVFCAAARPATAGWLDWLEPDITETTLTDDERVDKAMMQAVTGTKLTGDEYRRVKNTIPWLVYEAGLQGTGSSARRQVPERGSAE